MNDTTTRSGMVWEVLRILKECKEQGELPACLLMENVIQVHGADNVESFNRFQYELEKLGYKNYWKDLIATDYGIPQTRNRCFMVSILGDYNYTFPKPIPLKLKLKDMLEENVPKKYYLNDSMIKYIVSEDDSYKVNESKCLINRDTACSKTTREGWTRCDTSDYISEDRGGNYNLKKEMSSPNLKIKNNTKKGYLEGKVGDGVNISGRMEYQRGNVQKDKVQSITCGGGNNLGVIVNE